MPINGNEFEPGIFFGQMASVFGGLLLILLGVSIFYSIAYWARRGRRVEGEVIGVRCRGGQFHTVYRYAMPEGGFCEATSVQGSSNLNGRGTGTHRTIRVISDQPEEAHEPAAPAIWSLASGLVLGGAGLTWYSATTWKRSIFTWIFVALVSAVLGRFLWRRLAHLLKAVQGKIGAPQPWDALPIENAERLGQSSPTSRVRIVNSGPIRTPAIFLIVALGIYGTALIPIHKLLVLRSGTRAQGTVVWIYENTASHGSYSKFPEVQFTDIHGSPVRFLDKVGADPSPYKVGDRVQVLYQSGQQGSAMIDHGLSNWEPVVGLLVLGTVFLDVGLIARRGSLVAESQTKLAKQNSV